jgi:hypothetical protein
LTGRGPELLDLLIVAAFVVYALTAGLRARVRPREHELLTRARSRLYQIQGTLRVEPTIRAARRVVITVEV